MSSLPPSLPLSLSFSLSLSLSLSLALALRSLARSLPPLPLPLPLPLSLPLVHSLSFLARSVPAVASALSLCLAPGGHLNDVVWHDDVMRRDDVMCL